MMSRIYFFEAIFQSCIIPMGKISWELRRKIRQQDTVKQNCYVNLIYYHTEYLSKQIHHKLGHLPISLLHPCPPSFIVALNLLSFISLFFTCAIHIFYLLKHFLFFLFRLLANNNYINFP